LLFDFVHGGPAGLRAGLRREFDLIGHD
jgi:hypothetical protein